MNIENNLMVLSPPCVILLLVAASQAAELRSSRSKQKEETLSNNRIIVAESSNLDKRAPVLSTEAPSVTPGIEYADTKEVQQDNSPTQQIYATPVPQIAKISDVLTGQGPPFQAAIASHLYAPVSVYQARFASPTTYEVSAPIPSQLAYSEHKISYQPPQNAIQYTPQTQYEHTAKLLPLKQINFQRINQQQPYQQIFVQPQPIVYSQQLAEQQPIYHSLPQINYQPRLAIPQNEILRPVQYVQSPSVEYLRNQLQTPVSYIQPQQQLVLPAQPEITYAQNTNAAQNQQAIQKVLPTPVPRQNKVLEKAAAPEQKTNEQLQQPAQPTIRYVQPQTPVVYVQPQQAIAYDQPQPPQQPQQAFTYVQPQEQVSYTQPQATVYAQSQTPVSYSQPQGAVSFASFSQSQPTPTLNQQKSRQQYQQPIYQQPQYQQPQYQQPQHQQPQYQTVQYQAPQSLQTKSAVESVNVTKSPPPKQVIFRQRTVSPQPQVLSPQVYSQNQYLPQNPKYNSPALPEAPSFPPVQYFGNFARTIFSKYKR
ncbi:uncharacterized protein ACR2FA_004380 [Aphomia sociella]